MQLDDYVPAGLAFVKPLPKHDKLSRAKRTLVVSSIKCIIQLYRIDWLLSLFPGQTVFKVYQFSILLAGTEVTLMVTEKRQTNDEYETALAQMLDDDSIRAHSETPL